MLEDIIAQWQSKMDENSIPQVLRERKRKHAKKKIL